MLGPEQLIAIPADPTRSYAIRINWPTIGYWDWSAYCWRPVCTASCLLPFETPVGGDPADIAIVRPRFPVVDVPTILELVPLGIGGNPLTPVGLETIEPDRVPSGAGGQGHGQSGGTPAAR